MDNDGVIKKEENVPPVAPPKGRLFWGVLILIVGDAAPLSIPFIVGSGLSSEVKTIISGLLVFGIPELFMVVSVAILGKSGFAYVKSLFLGFFKRYAPPAHVSRTRYRIGLALFTFLFVVALLEPYVGHFYPWPEKNRLAYVIISDLLTLVSLFILGGDFWDKLRSLFFYEAKACFPAKDSMPQ